MMCRRHPGEGYPLRLENDARNAEEQFPISHAVTWIGTDNGPRGQLLASRIPLAEFPAIAEHPVSGKDQRIGCVIVFFVFDP